MKCPALHTTYILMVFNFCKRDKVKALPCSGFLEQLLDDHLSANPSVKNNTGSTTGFLRKNSIASFQSSVKDYPAKYISNEL